MTMAGEVSFGVTLRARSLGRLELAEVAMPPRLELDPHAHARGQLCLVLDGEYVETAGGRDHRLHAGAVVIRPPGEVHANRFPGPDPALVLVLTFPQERPAARGGQWQQLYGTGLSSYVLSPAFDDVRRELLAELDTEGAASDMAVDGLAFLLAARASRLSAAAPRREPRWIADAVTCVERRFRERLSLAAVAASVGVHPGTLAAAIRRHRATSVGELITRVRLRAALSALTGTRAPLAEIAAASGFYDQAHFGRLFRRHFGTTPAAYRRGVAGAR